MVEHRKQHWVGQSYLSAWCDPETSEGQTPYVWLFPKDGGAGRNKAPKNIFWETDMYTIKRSDGERDLRLERGLSGLETDFAELREKLEKGEASDAADHLILAAFTAAMQSRSPRQREHVRGQFSRILEGMTRFQDQMMRLPPEQRERIARTTIRGRGPSMGIEDVAGIVEAPLQSVMPAAIDGMFMQLAKMDQVVLVTDDDVGFITSDAPAAVWDWKRHLRPWPYNAISLEYPTAEVTLPISPRMMVVFNHKGQRGYVPVPIELVDDSNRLTRGVAGKEFVVRRNQTKPVWYEMGMKTPREETGTPPRP